MAIPSLVTLSGATNSNSYATEADLVLWSERRPHGVVLPAETRPMLLQAMLEKFGSDSLLDIKQAYKNYLKRIS